MQTEGKKILLLPAWPIDWNCTFKLHAPFQTTLRGHISGGKVDQLTVEPDSRRADITIYGGQHLP